MKSDNYKKSIFTFTVFAMFALTGCGDGELENKVNAFLLENGWDKISGGTKIGISRQFAHALLENDFGIDMGYDEHRSGKLSRVAEFLVENQFYETIKHVCKPYNEIYNYNTSHAKELFLIASMMVDAIPDKNPEEVEFMNFFYEEKNNWKYGIFYDRFYYLILDEDVPGIFEKINCVGKGTWFINDRRIYGGKWISGNEKFVRAVLKSSEEFKKAILMQLEIKDPLPSSIADNIFPDFKPSNPIKGKYLLVTDEEPHKLYVDSNSWRIADSNQTSGVEEIDADYVTAIGNGRAMHLYSYRTETLQPARKLSEADMVIYETYFYEEVPSYILGYVFLRHTHVKAVDAVTGKTIFDKTFKSTADQSYTVGERNKYHIDDDYRASEYAKLISEIVEKGL